MTDNDTDKKPLHGPNLILDVENFGPIAEAKNIEFRPMTVFVGPSNTGKSYLAMLLHAVLKTTARAREDLNLWRLGIPHGGLEGIDALALGTEIARSVRERNETNREGPYDESTNLPVQSLTEDGRREFVRISEAIIHRLLESIRQSVSEYFDVDDELELTRNDNTTAHHSLVELRLDDAHSDRIQLRSCDSRAVGFSMSNVDFVNSASDVPRFFTPEYLTNENIPKSVSDHMHQHVPRVYVHDIVKSAMPELVSHYLPASRTGIMESHATLTDRIIANASRISIDGRGLVRFHRISAEFLRAINAVHEVPTARDESEDAAQTIADNLEANVLGGSIDVDEGPVGLPRFFYGQEDTKIPLFRSSSMVTELAPLVLFLRNYVSIGDLVIVEEPESHLHPKAQQRLAGILALLVRSGIRILITTHSDYFVEQLGIFRNASALDGKTRAATMRCLGPQTDADLFLRDYEIGVYGFSQREQDAGTVVTEIPFDQEQWEYGAPDHTAAVIDQFNRNARVTEARIAQT